jgi:hypothetical protein
MLIVIPLQVATDFSDSLGGYEASYRTTTSLPPEDDEMPKIL